MDLKIVSQCAMSQIKNWAFKNVLAKPPGSNFSKCTECNVLQGCILKYPKDCPERQALVDDKIRHINYQNVCEQIYLSWSTQFVESLSKFLCIIHNTMDYTKTTVPWM